MSLSFLLLSISRATSRRDSVPLTKRSEELHFYCLRKGKKSYTHKSDLETVPNLSLRLNSSLFFYALSPKGLLSGSGYFGDSAVSIVALNIETL